MLPPLASPLLAREALNNLRSQLPLTSDELIAIDADVSARLVSLATRARAVRDGMAERPIVDRGLDAGAWAVGIGGIVVSCIDYHDTGGLGFGAGSGWRSGRSASSLLPSSISAASGNSMTLRTSLLISESSGRSSPTFSTR